MQGPMISGGYILVSRKLIESEIWGKTTTLSKSLDVPSDEGTVQALQRFRSW